MELDLCGYISYKLTILTYIIQSPAKAVKEKMRSWATRPVDLTPSSPFSVLMKRLAKQGLAEHGEH